MTITEENFTHYLRALNAGIKELEKQGETAVKMQVWSGKVIVVGSKNTGYVLTVECPLCPYAEKQEDEPKE